MSITHSTTIWTTTGREVPLHYRYDEQVIVSPPTIRRHFNDGLYWIRAELNHEFEQEVVYEEPVAPGHHQPEGTLSQEVIYHDRNDFVARVHQYLLPGEQRTPAGLPQLGGYGEPDPKELIEEQDERRIYFIARQPARRPRWSA